MACDPRERVNASRVREFAWLEAQSQRYFRPQRVFGAPSVFAPPDHPPSAKNDFLKRPWYEVEAGTIQGYNAGFNEPK